jgi:hypothetical protein
MTEDQPRDEGEEWLSPDHFPRLWNMSAGFMFPRVLRAEVPERPEFVTIRLGPSSPIELQNAVAEWNTAWEAAQYRRRCFSQEELPSPIDQIADKGDVNLIFVPRTRGRYYEYAPLLHLLPVSTLKMFGLPTLSRGQWPYVVGNPTVADLLPPDFEARLARAWAATTWRHLMPGSKLSGFTRFDPIRLLAHNLDFWLPHVTAVIENTLRSLPVARDEEDLEEPARLEDGSLLAGAVIGTARMGSDVWRGEAEAADVVAAVVDEADTSGQLRAILDAVRSNRVEDDFSDRWTFAREDFERKLYRKRSKTPVSFVELRDTIPVQSPETEVVDRHVLSDFMALLDEKENRVVVLLSSGMTRLTDIGSALGYANHSPISKRLAGIRQKAEDFFEDMD